MLGASRMPCGAHGNQSHMIQTTGRRRRNWKKWEDLLETVLTLVKSGIHRSLEVAVMMTYPLSLWDPTLLLLRMLYNQLRNAWSSMVAQRIHIILQTLPSIKHPRSCSHQAVNLALTIIHAREIPLGRLWRSMWPCWNTQQQLLPSHLAWLPSIPWHVC